MSQRELDEQGLTEGEAVEEAINRLRRDITEMPLVRLCDAVEAIADHLDRIATALEEDIEELSDKKEE